MLIKAGEGDLLIRLFLRIERAYLNFSSIPIQYLHASEKTMKKRQEKSNRVAHSS